MGDTTASHVQCVVACKGVCAQTRMCKQDDGCHRAEAWRSTGEARATAASVSVYRSSRDERGKGEGRRARRQRAVGSSCPGRWTCCVQTRQEALQAFGPGMCVSRLSSAPAAQTQLWAQEPRAAQTWPGMQPAAPDLALQRPLSALSRSPTQSVSYMPGLRSRPSTHSQTYHTVRRLDCNPVSSPAIVSVSVCYLWPRDTAGLDPP